MNQNISSTFNDQPDPMNLLFAIHTHVTIIFGLMPLRRTVGFNVWQRLGIFKFRQNFIQQFDRSFNFIATVVSGSNAKRNKKNENESFLISTFYNFWMDVTQLLFRWSSCMLPDNCRNNNKNHLLWLLQYKRSRTRLRHFSRLIENLQNIETTEN